jgi:nucleotide-binding universal stress UspA family protein
MTIRSILVATDLSVQDHLALQRAWQLAHAHRASVKLMYVRPQGAQVPHDAAALLADEARLLEQTFGLRVTTVGSAHGLEDVVAEARGTDLLVLPHRRERSTAAFFRGQPVLRILRGCNRPVLVARQARVGHYRRILVAASLSRGSQALVTLAADLDAHAELEIFHAIDTRGEAKLRAAEATEQAVRAYRARCLRKAQEGMGTLVDSLAAHRHRLLTAIGRGDPGRQTVVQQQRSGADLVVLGKRRSSAWADFLCGSVAHRALSWGSSDVLVVPHGYAGASAPVAAGRMKDTLGPGREACDARA